MAAEIPSTRNFEIYYAVEDQQMSLRDAAALFALTPQRVQRIVKQVERWYQTSTPAWVQEGDFMTRSLVAFRRHDERCKRLYDRAMQSFDASIGDHSTSEVKISDPRSAISRHSVKHGDPAFLTTALRISRERFLASAALAKLVNCVEGDAAAGSSPISVLTQERPDEPRLIDQQEEPLDASDWEAAGYENDAEPSDKQNQPS